MANRKNQAKAFLAILIVACFFPRSGLAQTAGNWQSYTATTEVRGIDYFNDSVQAVTSGGWLRIDPITHGIKKLTNVDGLGTADLYDILKDNNGRVWLAGLGRLIKVDAGNFTPYLFFDRNDQLMTLYSLVNDGDLLWVGTSAGLALFSKTANGGQIEDFYFRFGDLEPEPAIYDIELSGDSIWLATSAGLAVAERANPDLLKLYVNWTTFSSAKFPELAGDTISAVARFNNSIYVGTRANAYPLDINCADTSVFEVPTREPVAIKSMEVTGDTLAIYTSNGFYFHTPDSTIWNSTPTIPSPIFLSGHFVSGIHWIGLQTSGVYYGSGGSYSNIPDGGLPGNYATALDSDPAGNVAGGFQTRDPAVFDGLEWTKAGIVGIIPNGVRQGARAVALDDHDNFWIGTWGNGLMLAGEDSIINFDENNSSLRGVSENPNYVVVNSLAKTANYLFMTNYRAIDGRSVSVVDLNDLSRWNFFGRNDSLTSEFPISIDYYDGTIAVGTQNNGVFTYYCGADPFIETNALAVNLREDNSQLGSNTVNVVKYDHSGTLWAGTKFGLSRYDAGIPRFENIVLPVNIDPAVMALTFDNRDNIWIGTRNGLAFYNTATDEFTIYNTLNSGLIDNQINSLALNPATGDLWVGTPSGLSRFRSSIGIPTTELDRVYAFPNPFIIKYGSERLGFNYDGKATIRIFSSGGEIVRTMPINISWDGKNESGRDVASGVYLVLITNEEGEVGRCKVLLVRD